MQMDDAEEEPLPCGDQSDDGQVCAREAGHSGRHKASLREWREGQKQQPPRSNLVKVALA